MFDVFAEMQDKLLPLIISLLAAYLLGSINFAIIATKLFGKGDIRSHGSGNAGTTNVLRSAGFFPALITFLGDLLKASLAVFLAGVIFKVCGFENIDNCYVPASYLAGLFCILGHMFPVFYGFKGGKGVMTTVGMYLVLDIRIFGILFVVFVTLLAITKIVSICSVVSAVTLPFSTFFIIYFFDFKGAEGYSQSLLVFNTVISAFVAFMIIFKHRENIKRILKGEEKKLSMKKG